MTSGPPAGPGAAPPPGEPGQVPPPAGPPPAGTQPGAGPPPPWAAPPPPGAPPSGGPPPVMPPVQPWQISRLVLPSADASVNSQVVTYLVAIFAVGLVAHVAGEMAIGALLSAVLLGGVVVGAVGGTARWFRNLPGIFLGICASAATAIGLGILGSATGAGFEPLAVAVFSLGVGFFLAGLDWTTVGRLRAVPPLAAVPVLLVSLSGEGPMLALCLAWLALAVAAMWSLELDQRAAFSDPRPLAPTEAAGSAVNSGDLAGAVGVALLVGVLFAFSASMPSCSVDLPGLGGLDFGDREIGGRDVRLDGGILDLDALREAGFPFDFSGSVPSIDLDGVEHLLRIDPSGMLYLENLETGERFPLRLEDGNLVARNAYGDVVAVIRPDPPDEGGSTPWKTVLAVAGAFVLAGLLLWAYLRHRRRRPAGPDHRQWAEDLVARLDRFGRAHGTPRHRSETVAHHAGELVRDVAPDPRLHDVARAIADALFDREQPTMERRIWAEQVVDEIEAAHPPPSRIERVRRRRSGRRDGGRSGPGDIGAPPGDRGAPGSGAAPAERAPEQVGPPPTIGQP